MSIKKTATYAIAGLLGIVISILAIGVFSPSGFHVSRSAVVAAPAEAVFVPIANLRDWNDWSSWNTQKDPSLKYSYGGETGQVGSFMEWKSEKNGVGRVTLVEVVPNSRIKYRMEMDGGKFHADGELTLNPVPEGTQVVWSDKGDMGNNPLFKFLGLFMDAILGADFQEGLDNLKQRVEAKNEKKG